MNLTSAEVQDMSSLLDQLLAGFSSKVIGWRTSRESVGVPRCDIDFVQFTGGVQDRRGRLV